MKDIPRHLLSLKDKHNASLRSSGSLLNLHTIRLPMMYSQNDLVMVLRLLSLRS